MKRVKAKDLEQGDELADGSIVDSVYPEDEMVWIDWASGDSISDAGYIHGNDTFTVVNRD